MPVSPVHDPGTCQDGTNAHSADAAPNPRVSAASMFSRVIVGLMLGQPAQNRSHRQAGGSAWRLWTTNEVAAWRWYPRTSARTRTGSPYARAVRRTSPPATERPWPQSPQEVIGNASLRGHGDPRPR